MNVRRVTIIQEYVPAYRVPLFDMLRSICSQRDIDLTIAAGAPHGRQAERKDESLAAIDAHIEQREWSVLGRRLVWRDVRDLYSNSDLVVVEQARRNIDVYREILRRRTKIAFWGHGRDFTHSPGRLSSAIQMSLTRQASWFFGYTLDSVAHVVSAGYPESRTTVLWNTTDTAALRRDLAEVAAADRSRFRAGYDHVALFVGGLDESKRLDVLIDACDRIASEVESFRLVVAGAGVDAGFIAESAKSRPWLHATGPLAGRQLATALAASDILAMPGRVGLVAVDALTAGLPTVTTTWPLHGPERAYLDASTSVTTGLSAREFADGTIELLRDPARRNAMSRACARMAAQLSIEAMAERFVSGIEGALRA